MRVRDAADQRPAIDAPEAFASPLPRGLIVRVLAGAALAAMLAGCSGLYTARRDSIAYAAGDSIAANTAMQTIDPWPPYSANPNIAFDGQRMQGAVERYREGKVAAATDPMQIVGASQEQGNSTQVNIGGSALTSGSSATGGASATSSGAAASP